MRSKKSKVKERRFIDGKWQIRKHFLYFFLTGIYQNSSMEIYEKGSNILDLSTFKLFVYQWWNEDKWCIDFLADWQQLQYLKEMWKRFKLKALLQMHHEFSRLFFLKKSLVCKVTWAKIKKKWGGGVVLR